MTRLSLYLIIIIYRINNYKIGLTLFSSCSNHCLSPHRRGILKKIVIAPHEGEEKFPLETGERGSFSKLPQRINE